MIADARGLQEGRARAPSALYMGRCTHAQAQLGCRVLQLAQGYAACKCNSVEYNRIQKQD
jgi:hypothetical protein